MRSVGFPMVLALTVFMALAPGEAATAPRQVVAGLPIYTLRCASCHGRGGHAAPGWDHPDAAGEMPPPPHDAEGHTWKHSDAMLYRIVANGWRDRFNKTPRLTMPPFSATMTPAEIRDVIAYLKTLWTPEQRKFQLEESEHAPFPPEALKAP